MLAKDPDLLLQPLYVRLTAIKPQPWSALPTTRACAGSAWLRRLIIQLQALPIHANVPTR